MGDRNLRMLQLRQEECCCTQIMLIMALETQNRTNAALIRAARGLCYGIGMSGEVCGGLSGAACLLSHYAGKGSENDKVDERHPLMLAELVEWFRESVAGNYGGMRCDEIPTAYPDKSVCSPIVAYAYSRAMEILGAHGFGPSQGKDD
jgi:hypothetical protein